MISAILLLCQMLMITGLTINLSEQCTCEHYSQEMCNFYSFCSWNNDKCGNIVCANKPKDMCTADYTDFKCEYDSVDNVCKEKKYTCNDLGANYCRFSKILGMNCIWSINDKCEDFDCAIAKNCPFKYCAFSNNKCSNPTTKIDCTALTQCQLSSDGFGNFCLANEDKVCKSYDAQIECSQWNDQPLLSCFSIGCQIEDFKCRDKKCSDFYTQNSCTYIYEDDSNSITVCKWTGRNCVEATSQDIEAFTKYDCVVNSVLTYEWENEKCQKCVNPVSTEVTNNTNQNNNQPSSSSTGSNSSSTSSSSTTSSSTINQSNTSTSNTSTSNTSSSNTSSSNTTSNTSNTQPSTNENTNQTPTNYETQNNQSNSQSQTNETPTESSTTNNEGTQGENNNQTPITNETEPNSNEETSNQFNQENSNQNNTLNTNSTLPHNQTQSNNTSSSQNSTNTQNTTATTVINQVQNNGTNQTQIFSNLTQQIKAQIGANNLLEISVQMFEHLLWITIALIYLS